tara:strand:- start:22 stop:1464 length:1443 start_codon:yes stop_codon:yes gene_type:complete
MGNNSKRVLNGNEVIERFAGRGFNNAKEFAEFLHEVDGRRSIDAWRVAINRWVKKGNSYLPPNITDGDVESKARTYYDESKDKYLTFLTNTSEILVIAGDKHRDMRRSYSNIGGALTYDEVATKYDMPSHIVEMYVKAWKWRHAMDPFTDEEISLKESSSLVDDYISIKRKDVVVKAEKELQRRIEKDAMSWREFRHTIADEFADLVKLHKGKVTKTKMKIDSNDFALVVSPTDLHFGKYGWISETGEQYSRNEARKRLISKTENLLSRLPSAPEKIYVTAGSDWFHIDNDLGGTTKGTPQDIDGSPAQILMEGVKLACDHIDILRSVAPVEIILMAGNHDRHTSLMLMMYLEAAYKDAEDVTVIINAEPRQYLTYGKSLLGFTHGDKINLNNLPSIMSIEEREKWGETKHHVWFHGHLHHLKVSDKNGATVIQLPSLAGHDRYHTRAGYVMERKGLCAHMIDKELGVVANLFSPVIDDE